jgi:hypothetical protein
MGKLGICRPRPESNRGYGFAVQPWSGRCHCFRLHHLLAPSPDKSGRDLLTIALEFHSLQNFPGAIRCSNMGESITKEQAGR